MKWVNDMSNCSRGRPSKLKKVTLEVVPRILTAVLTERTRKYSESVIPITFL